MKHKHKAVELADKLYQELKLKRKIAKERERIAKLKKRLSKIRL